MGDTLLHNYSKLLLKWGEWEPIIVITMPLAVCVRLFCFEKMFASDNVINRLEHILQSSDIILNCSD